jgi:hypothetical protein
MKLRLKFAVALRMPCRIAMSMRERDSGDRPLAPDIKLRPSRQNLWKACFDSLIPRRAHRNRFQRAHDVVFAKSSARRFVKIARGKSAREKGTTSNFLS